MTNLYLVLLWIASFIAFNIFSLTLTEERYKQGLLLNTLCKKIIFLPALIHYIGFFLLWLLSSYAVMMSLFRWSEHPLMEKLSPFWEFWWYWLLVAPIIWIIVLYHNKTITPCITWVTSLNPNEIMTTYITKKNQIISLLPLLAKTIVSIIFLLFVLAIVIVIVSFFGHGVSLLFNWIY